MVSLKFPSVENHRQLGKFQLRWNVACPKLVTVENITCGNQAIFVKMFLRALK